MAQTNSTLYKDEQYTYEYIREQVAECYNYQGAGTCEFEGLGFSGEIAAESENDLYDKLASEIATTYQAYVEDEAGESTVKDVTANFTGKDQIQAIIDQEFMYGGLATDLTNFTPDESGEEM